jgi:hypothetical protein
MISNLKLNQDQPGSSDLKSHAEVLGRGAIQIARFALAEPKTSLSGDLLRGAAEIAEFVFGDSAQRRRVYHLATEVQEERRIPIFRLGNVLCARRSTLLRWIAEQEAGAP